MCVACRRRLRRVWSEEGEGEPKRLNRDHPLVATVGRSPMPCSRCVVPQTYHNKFGTFCSHPQSVRDTAAARAAAPEGFYEPRGDEILSGLSFILRLIGNVLDRGGFAARACGGARFGFARPGIRSLLPRALLRAARGGPPQQRAAATPHNLAVPPNAACFRLFSIYGTSGNREMPRTCVPTANPPRWYTKQHWHGS